MPIILTSQDNSLCVNGQPISTSGTTSFTLEILEGFPILTANSINNTTDTSSLVRTQESYYTAYLSCKINTVPTQGQIGFVSVFNRTTFAFSFDFADGNVGISINGQGSQSIGSTITSGDNISIALTSNSCTFFINGYPIYNTISIDNNYLNVVAQFYSTGIYETTNINFKYLANPIVG